MAAKSSSKKSAKSLEDRAVALVEDLATLRLEADEADGKEELAQALKEAERSLRATAPVVNVD